MKTIIVLGVLTIVIASICWKVEETRIVDRNKAKIEAENIKQQQGCKYGQPMPFGRGDR